MAENRELRTCPVRSIFSGPAAPALCAGEDCAWFVGGRCAVIHIAVAAANTAASLEEVRRLADLVEDGINRAAAPAAAPERPEPARNDDIGDIYPGERGHEGDAGQAPERDPATI